MARWGQIFDKKFLVRHLAVWLGAMVVCYVTKGAGVGLLFLPMFYSLLQKRHDLLLVFLTIFVGFPMSNHVLVPKGAAFNLEVKILWFVLASLMSVQVFGRRQSPLATPFIGILVYALYMLVPSTFGWCPAISYLKLLLFVITFLAFYEIANEIILGPRTGVIQIRSAFLAFACYILVGSVLLIPFPSISQMRIEQFLEALQAGRNLTSLYCGMMYHSQALGPVVAVMFVMVFSDFLFSVRKWNWLYLILLACAPILVFKTSSRTAMGTLLAGAFFVTLLFLKTRQVESRWRLRVVFALVALCLVGSVGISVHPKGRAAIARFVLKVQTAEELRGVNSEDLLSTRQALIDHALYNFRASPVIGNGFQVSDEYAGAKISNFKQLLSAPIEKGVWVTAILEEGGLLGFTIFVVFAVGCIIKLVLRKAYTGAAVFFTLLVSNLGEFSIFAMSGVGGYAWAMCFMGIILDAQRLREQHIIYWAATPDEGESYEEVSMRMYGEREPIYVLPSSQR